MNDPRLEAMGDTPGSDVCGCSRAAEFATRLTAKQRHALELLEAGVKIPETWTGALVAEETFWDGEIGVACIHYTTAHALHRRGLIEYGERDPEWGTEIVLVAE